MGPFVTQFTGVLLFSPFLSVFLQNCVGLGENSMSSFQQPVGHQIAGVKKHDGTPVSSRNVGPFMLLGLKRLQFAYSFTSDLKRQSLEITESLGAG